eukprot:3674780-Pyramimonas_sp.AAC.1
MSANLWHLAAAYKYARGFTTSGVNLLPSFISRSARTMVGPYGVSCRASMSRAARTSLVLDMYGNSSRLDLEQNAARARLLT